MISLCHERYSLGTQANSELSQTTGEMEGEREASCYFRVLSPHSVDKSSQQGAVVFQAEVRVKAHAGSVVLICWKEIYLPTHEDN